MEAPTPYEERQREIIESYVSHCFMFWNGTFDWDKAVGSISAAKIDAGGVTMDKIVIPPPEEE
jgi:hypothetical protein